MSRPRHPDPHPRHPDPYPRHPELDSESCHSGLDPESPISVFVKPGSKKGPLVEKTPDGLTVYLPEKAHDGAANTALIKLLAKHFNVSKSQVEILRGAHSRHKLIQILK